MKVTTEDAGPCRKLMHIHAEPQEVHDDYEKIVRVFRSEGRVPGFRRGKAPAGVVERHYVKQIAEEAKDRLIPGLYRKALAQEAVTPLAIVDVTQVDFSKENGLGFDVLIDIAPQFKLPRYRKISLVRNTVEVTDEDVEGALKQLLEAHARYEEADEGAVGDADFVMVDYNGEQPVGEHPGECAELEGGVDFWVMVGGRELLPGLGQALIGKAVGDTFTFDAGFGDDYNVEAVRGKTVTYTVTIKQRRERRPPELNAEFLKQFEVDTEAALRDRLREDLLQHKTARETGRLKEEIGKYLLGKVKFDLPMSVVQEEMQLMVRDIVDRIARQGATREQIEEQQPRIMETATQASQDRVRLSFILARISAEETIAVSADEVTARIEQMAARYGMEPEKLRSELEKRNSLERLESDLAAEKTMEFLLEQAKIKEK